MNKLIFCILVAITTGCATKAIYTITPQNGGASYQDEFVSISFSFPQQFASSRKRDFTTYYATAGIGIIIENQSDADIVVDWNKVFVRDYNGKDGNPVMHRGVKYADCSTSKVPTTIPPGGRISDVIIPCYAIWLNAGGWNADIFPEPSPGLSFNIGLNLPIQINGTAKKYAFEFDAVAH